MKKGNHKKSVRILFTSIIVILIVIISLLAMILLSVKFTARPPSETSTFFIKNDKNYQSNYYRMVKQTFSAEKKKHTYRLFILGGSQAMGTPYVHQDYSLRFNFLDLPEGGGIATWLNLYLEKIYPNKKIEVINAAVGGENIETVSRTFMEIAQIGSPDLVIILSGNNEFSKQSKNNLQHPKSIPEFETLLLKLTQNYEQSLRNITALADSLNIQTYLLTVPTNIRDWQPLPYTKKGSRDPMAYFNKGKKMLAFGKNDVAYNAFLFAKDHDPLLMRAHSNFNKLIREVTPNSNIKVIDMEQIIRKYSDNRIPGFDLFHDWCHMKLTTNKLFAAEIVKFHLNEQKIKQTLPTVSLPAGVENKIQLLYFVKKIKWFRLKYFGNSNLGTKNIENVQKQY